MSTPHQHTIPMQLRELRDYAGRRGWDVAGVVEEIASGTRRRPARDEIMRAARRREIDAVLVWRLDRWGRSVEDLLLTLHELDELGVAFVSLTEALDMSCPSGRAMAAMLAVFAEFESELRSERIRAGLEHARREGRPIGRPRTAAVRAADVRELADRGLKMVEIARRLGIGRTSVRRILKGEVRA